MKRISYSGKSLQLWMASPYPLRCPSLHNQEHPGEGGLSLAPLVGGQQAWEVGSWGAAPKGQLLGTAVGFLHETRKLWVAKE